MQCKDCENKGESMNKPIGVIDSGVGGLTVAKEIMKTVTK